MSIEGVGQQGRAARWAQRAAPIGAGLATASCSAEATSIALSVALFTFLLLGVTPAQTRRRVLKRAGEILSSPFRSILARGKTRLAAKHTLSLPNIDDIYTDGVRDEQWRSFCYDDLLKRVAKRDEFRVRAVLSRHGLSWEKFVDHPRPFKRGNGSLVAQDVMTISRELGLSSEDAYRASVAWSVRATRKRLDPHHNDSAIPFFTCLATVALDEQHPSTEIAREQGYTEEFAQMLSRSAHFIRSGMPHAHQALKAFLEASRRTDGDVAGLGTKALQRQSNITEAVSLLAHIEPLVGNTACNRFELGDRLRDAHTAGVILLLTDPFDIPPLQAIGLETIARHAIMDVYYPLYQTWKREFPHSRTRLTPQNMSRLSTLTNAPPQIRHILTRA